MIKTILFVVDDEHIDSVDVELLQNGFINTANESDLFIIQKIRLSTFKEFRYYVVPINTYILVFVIDRSDRKLCEELLDCHDPNVSITKIDFHYINSKFKKKEENKTMNIIEERAVSAKETIDELINSHKRLRGIEDFCNNDKIAKEYIHKAIKNVESLGSIQSIDYYVEAIKMMSNDINNLNNLLTNYLEEINNNKKDLEEYNKMKPLINHLKSVFKED